MAASNIAASISYELKKAYLRGKVNSPFLSGDVFAVNSDVSVYSPSLKNNVETKREVSQARVVFCPSDKLEILSLDFGQALKASVLILGNSDRDFHEGEIDLPRGVRHVFAQNLCFASSWTTTLPIGLENLSLAKNGRQHLYNEKYSMSQKKEAMLIGPFSPTHPERLALRSLAGDLSGDARIDFREGLIGAKNYATLASQFAYIAAPRGNGIDTHRFWEALYRGSKPVVVKSGWSQNLKAHSLPFVELGDWTTDETTNLFGMKRDSFVPREVEPLWWPYWRRLIQSHL